MRNNSELSPRKTTVRLLSPVPPLPHSLAHPPHRSGSPLLGWAARLMRSALLFFAPPTAPQAPAPREASPWDRVTIHTDGSFHLRDERMGWGAVICRRGRGAGGVLGILAGGAYGGHAAQAEANAIAEALESLPSTTLDVVLCTDCKNLVTVLRRALRSRSGRNHGVGGGVDERTMERLRAAAAGRRIEFQWERGHDGNPLNEAADMLAGFGSGEPIPHHPARHARHPRARGAAVARLIHG